MGKSKKDIKNNGGKYVATKSFSSQKIVASGKDIVAVYEEAVKSGIKDPVINYIPEAGYACLF